MTFTFQKYNVIAVVVFVVFIIISHLLATEPYNWKTHTVSELASQGYSRKWIMQMGFILFGAILLVGIVDKALKGSLDFAIDIPIGVYALAIAVSGVFCTKPINNDIDYSSIESGIHSISASAAGIAFSLGILSSGIKAKNNVSRSVHFACLIFVIAMSMYFGMSSSNNGLIQKLMYLGSFYWITVWYNHNSSSPN